MMTSKVINSLEHEVFLLVLFLTMMPNEVIEGFRQKVILFIFVLYYQKVH